MLLRISHLGSSRKGGLFAATLLNILLFFSRGLPLGFLILVIHELFKPVPDTDRITIYIVAMLGILLLQLVLAAVSHTRMFVTSFQIAGDLRLKLGEHLRKLSLGFFKKRDPGDITAPLLQDMKNLEAIFSRLYPNVIASLVFPITTLAFLFTIDWRLSWVVAGFILLSLPALILSNRVIEKSGQKIIGLRTRASSQMLEYFYGMKEIKSHNLKGTKFKRLDDTLNQLRIESTRMEAFVAPLLFLYMLVLELGFIAVLLLGTTYMFQKSLDVYMFLLFLVIGNRVNEMLLGLGIFVVEMRYMNVAARRVSSVLKTDPLPEPQQRTELERHDIQFDNVTFGYNSRKVLKGVSFTARQNSLTALVGPSGSGKTTITNLIPRFWDVDGGEIRIGGKNVKALTYDHLLSNISAIFQDVYLFNDTVYNNIKVGKPDATREEVIAAAKASQCHEFVRKLPDGYDSRVGEGGARISGGEKQRISIARAILKDAPIILLDEATASLDPENERYIQKAINNLVHRKTLIVIAHRLSTISHADQILVIDDGRIKEQGTHDSLISQNGFYRHFWEVQQQTSGWTLNAQVPSYDKARSA